VGVKSLLHTQTQAIGYSNIPSDLQLALRLINSWVDENLSNQSAQGSMQLSAYQNSSDTWPTSSRPLQIYHTIHPCESVVPQNRHLGIMPKANF